MDPEKKANGGICADIANGSFYLSVSLERLNQETMSDQEQKNCANVSSIQTQNMNGSINGLSKKIDCDKIEPTFTNGYVTGSNTNELYRNSGPELNSDVTAKKVKKPNGRFRSTLSQVELLIIKYFFSF